MRILFINTVFYIEGGAEKILFDSARLLESHHHQVAFFCSNHPRNLRTEFSKYFTYFFPPYNQMSLKQKIQYPFYLLYSREAIRKIRLLINEWRPDIAHIHNMSLPMSPSIILELKRHNIPVVMSLHSYKLICPQEIMFACHGLCERCKDGHFYHMLFQKCIDKSFFKSFYLSFLAYCYARVFSKADLCLSPSLFLKNKYKEMGFKNEIMHVPNFVDYKDYIPQYNSLDKSIAYFGRLVEEKGIHILLDAIKGLDVKLKIIGRGPWEHYLKKKVEKEDISNVQFLGYLEQGELKKEIGSTMFTVMPSIWYENASLSILESFALGKPVVGSRIGGIPELIKDNVTGLLCNPGDATDFRNKIIVLMKDQNLIESLGKNGRAFVENHFTFGEYYNLLMQEYARLIQTVPKA